MPNTKQLVVCLGIGFLALILGYTTDINPLQSKLQHGREQKIKLKQMLQNKTHEAQKIKISPTQDAALFQKPVGDFSIADILNNLEKASFDSHAELQLFEPQPVKEEDSFTIYSVKLEAHGPYKKLLGFINNILKQSYFALFEELILQKKSVDDGNNELNLQASLVIYKNKKPTENAIKNNLISLSERDIFVKATSKVNLFLWSNKELRFLGLIKQNQNIYGFVSDPMSMIHRVAVGDKIGLKQSKVIAIDEHGITTTDSRI
jgi:Tfp pilus assembly protein PilO